MEDELEDVWHSRDLPFLREVARRVEAGPHPPRLRDVARDLGLSAEEANAAAKRLEKRGLLDITWISSGGSRLDTTGEALVITGLHPSGEQMLDRLLSALQQVADENPDEETASAAQKTRRGLLDMGKEVATGVLVAIATGAVS